MHLYNHNNKISEKTNMNQDLKLTNNNTHTLKTTNNIYEKKEYQM